MGGFKNHEVQNTVLKWKSRCFNLDKKNVILYTLGLDRKEILKQPTNYKTLYGDYKPLNPQHTKWFLITVQGFVAGVLLRILFFMQKLRYWVLILLIF